MQFFAADSCGVVALDTTESIVEVYNTFHSLAHSSKRTFKVPPETWMVHAGDNMLFTVSNDNEIRSALHFGVRTELGRRKMNSILFSVHVQSSGVYSCTHVH